MSKKTVRKAPGSRKPSPKKTKGLIAKGEKTGQSVEDPCVLDNLSHRTFWLLPNRRNPFVSGLSYLSLNHLFPLALIAVGRLGRRPPPAAAAGNSNVISSWAGRLTVPLDFGSAVQMPSQRVRIGTAYKPSPKLALVSPS
jgi:hypothetical protein